MFFRASLCGLAGNENRDGKVGGQDASGDDQDLFDVARKFLEAALVLLHALLHQGRHVPVRQCVHGLLQIFVLGHHLGRLSGCVANSRTDSAPHRSRY